MNYCISIYFIIITYYTLYFYPHQRRKHNSTAYIDKTSQCVLRLLIFNIHFPEVTDISNRYNKSLLLYVSQYNRLNSFCRSFNKEIEKYHFILNSIVRSSSYSYYFLILLNQNDFFQEQFSYIYNFKCYNLGHSNYNVL